MSSSRPASLALLPSSSHYISPPSLQDILSNTAPPPWSLSAFMAFLSQNHCLETLEFTMDAERYRAAHTEILARESTGRTRDENEHVCDLWIKLINAYILPCGPRELNIPSRVRDRLLSLPATTTPPDPSELDDAVRIVYELMNDSVLVPFLQSVAPCSDPQGQDDKESHESRQRRSHLRSQNHSVSSNDDSNRSPKAHFLPLFGLSRSNEQGASSGDQAEGGLSDDSGSVGSPHEEPVTPPTTPPTPDWGSPTPLQRAISAHNSGWKKVGQKLGINRKGRGNSKRQSTSVTSGVPDADGAGSGSGASSSSNPPL